MDAFTHERQVPIEYTVVERTQFDLHECGVLCDCAGELKKRQQPPPGCLRIGWRFLLSKI